MGGNVWRPNNIIKKVITNTINAKRPIRRLKQRRLDIVELDLDKCVLGFRLEKTEKDGVR